MADLDDFFAKKDRKKSKSKKFSTSEEIAKKLDEPVKKPEKPTKKERVQEGEEGTVTEHEQDEWKEFEEEKKDYTGLKIGHLSINPNSEGNNGSQDNGDEQQPTYDEAGNEVEKAGPWKRVSGDPAQEAANATAAISEEQRKAEPAAVLTVTQPNVSSGGVYMPPSKRNAQHSSSSSSSSHQPMQSSRLRNKAAPDIHNEDFFPTLAGGKGDKRGRNEGTFEVVAHNRSSSLRHVEQTKNSGTGAKLALGNRYNTLSNDS